MGRHRGSSDIGEASSAGTTPRHPLATDDALQIIDGHCRYIATKIPPSVLGGESTREYLANVRDACRRGVPDLAGTPRQVIAEAATFDLFATIPCDKVARAIPRLLARHSPIAQLRGPRDVRLWLVRLLDPTMLEKLRAATPQIYQVPSPTPPRRRAQPRRAQARALDEALAELARVRDELTTERRRRASMVRAAETERASLVQEREALIQEREEFRRAAAIADELRVALADLESRHGALQRRAAEAEVYLQHYSALHAEVVHLRPIAARAAWVESELAALRQAATNRGQADMSRYHQRESELYRLKRVNEALERDIAALKEALEAAKRR